jgi:hypothetical protein
MGLQDRDYMRERRLNKIREDEIKKILGTEKKNFSNEVELNLKNILRAVVNASALLIVVIEGFKLLKNHI